MIYIQPSNELTSNFISDIKEIEAEILEVDWLGVAVYFPFN